MPRRAMLTNKMAAEDRKKPTGSPSVQMDTSSMLDLQQMVGNQATMQMTESDSKPIPSKNIKEIPLPGMKENRKDRVKDKQKESKAVQLNQKRGIYGPGMHGSKKKEQRRLSDTYGINVTGSTHESEHTVGFEPLNQTSGLTRGKEHRAKSLENRAPAYQEVKELHRDHIGTGTTNKRDESGMNSQEYRDAQRSLIETGDVSSAVQLNQLGYAFDSKKTVLGSTEGKAATDSYDNMVQHMDSLTYANQDEDVTVSVDARQKTEMYLARRAMETGKFPTEEEENAARAKFGVPLISKESG